MNHQIRHVELDIAKGMGIYFMILVHVFLTYFSFGDKSAPISSVIYFLGRYPAAPMFMFSLGVGIAFSRRNSSKELFHRGIRLLIIAYLVVNVFLYEIPYLLLSVRDGWYIGPLQERIISDIPTIFCVDILQFAGLVFLYFSLAKKQGWKNRTLVIQAICFSILGMILRTTVSIHNQITRNILGLFWGTSDSSYFPFTSWVIFPIGGYLLGSVGLKNCRNKTKFYVILGSIGLILYVVLSCIGVLCDIQFANFGEIREPSDYYHMSLYGNICVRAFLMTSISLCYFASRIMPAWLVQIMQRFSRHITPIYIIHYAIIYYFRIVVGGSFRMALPGVLAMSFAILISSEIIVSIWEHLRKNHILRQTSNT